MGVTQRPRGRLGRGLGFWRASGVRLHLAHDGAWHCWLVPRVLCPGRVPEARICAVTMLMALFSLLTCQDT